MDLKVKVLDNVTYVYKTMAGEHPVYIGIITGVQYYNNDFITSDGTYSFYATDGYSLNWIGRYKPNELLDVATKCMFKKLTCTNDMLDEWRKDNP